MFNQLSVTSQRFTVLLLFLNLLIISNNLILCNEFNTNDGENMQNQQEPNESLQKPSSSTSATSSTSTSSSTSASSSIDQCELPDSGHVWSSLLEDYVVNQNSASQRRSKDLPITYSDYPLENNMHMGFSNGPQPNQPLNYHSSAYKRPNNNNNIYITRRIGEAAELEPHMRKPPVENPQINPQFRPMTNQMLQQRQQPSGFLQQLLGFGGGNGNGNGGGPPPSQQSLRPVQLQQPPSAQHHLSHLSQAPPPPPAHSNSPQTFRAVSENDLYLLGAIEKLVYRVDYLESRIRRSEQLIYYLMAGNNQKEVKDPCPSNFTRINDNCYYINSHQQVNWKTANSACKALNSHLAEFERVSENEEIMAYLLNQPNHRGRDYWLGGLNPGLLWIWSNSAKPVNPNMNLTSIAMTQKQHEDELAQSNLVDSDDDENDDDDKDKKSDPNESILNNTIEIKGQGRCLRLSYNAAKHSYVYYGQECTSRHHYICEAEDKTLDNKIKKITRELKLLF